MRKAVFWAVLRRGVGAAAVTAALAASSGCTVPIDAVTGISVTGDGHLLGVIRVCGHHIDGATLSPRTDGAEGSRTIGSWTAAEPFEAGLTTWSLDSPSPGWTTTTPLGPLVAGTTYTLYGWTDDNSWSSAPVSFTVADRDRLAPGQVLRESVTDGGEALTSTVSSAEFEAGGCE
ncbi:hypothetical protein [Streptomyces sp. AM 2-1-1]|uniref:hypothetical protein n=1 Tax=Streptomyces sp. AM 2-1-1 TaxID=3028709 RepID=UPI0023B910BC|nr:hypothetical protein [Streptomyces sp. AM 2-1-1]WEH40316.1 hypothetical protein PZB77_12775 [Streptomyces sp. AM 2-1-1]